MLKFGNCCMRVWKPRTRVRGSEGHADMTLEGSLRICWACLMSFWRFKWIGFKWGMERDTNALWGQFIVTYQKWCIIAKHCKNSLLLFLRSHADSKPSSTVGSFFDTLSSVGEGVPCKKTHSKSHQEQEWYIYRGMVSMTDTFFFFCQVFKIVFVDEHFILQ